jgi:hypothetical protein
VFDAELGEHARRLVRAGELIFGAEQLEHAAGAVIECNVRFLPQLLETCLAVMCDALHARLVAREALGVAVAQKPRKPAPLMRVEPRPHDDRCVHAEQPARDLERHSRRRPWPRKSRADAAGIGEARLQTRPAPALDHGDLVAGLREIIGAARSNHARAEDHHPHGARAPALTRP